MFPCPLVVHCQKQAVGCPREPKELRYRRRRPMQGLRLWARKLHVSNIFLETVDKTMLTFGCPSDNIDSLSVFGQGRQVFNLPILAFTVNFPYANVVITASGSEPALAVRFEVSRINGGVLVVPVYNQWSGLHFGDLKGI